MKLVIFNGCKRRFGSSPSTNIVNVEPRSTSIQPNKPPFPLESLVVYLNTLVLVDASYSEDTIIVTGVETHSMGVGVGV